MCELLSRCKTVQPDCVRTSSTMTLSLELSSHPWRTGAFQDLNIMDRQMPAFQNIEAVNSFEPLHTSLQSQPRSIPRTRHQSWRHGRYSILDLGKSKSTSPTAKFIHFISRFDGPKENNRKERSEGTGTISIPRIEIPHVFVMHHKD